MNTLQYPQITSMFLNISYQLIDLKDKTSCISSVENHPKLDGHSQNEKNDKVQFEVIHNAYVAEYSEIKFTLDI
jgi:hypothetical protein